MAGTKGNSAEEIKKELDYQAELRRQREVNAPFWNRVRLGLEPDFAARIGICGEKA